MDLHAEPVSGPEDASGAHAPQIPGGIPAEEVRLLLENILRSKAFSMSKRCGDFLAYVVEQTLLGHQHELKERTIGVAVFGRPASYDTGEDAIVRIKASETRRRLAAYYAEQGTELTVMLTLPSGGYVPQFAGRSWREVWDWMPFRSPYQSMRRRRIPGRIQGRGYGNGL
jgi:hypothetical protein